MQTAISGDKFRQQLIEIRHVVFAVGRSHHPAVWFKHPRDFRECLRDVRHVV